MYVWIWPSVTVSARIWRFAGKKSRDCPRQSRSQRFSSFINLTCYGVPQNYLHSDGPSALFLVKERLIAGYLKQERIKGASLASKEEHYVDRSYHRLPKRTTDKQLNLSLVLISRRATSDIAAGTACDALPTWEQKSPATEAMSLYRRHACEVDSSSTSQACRQ